MCHRVVFGDSAAMSPLAESSIENLVHLDGPLYKGVVGPKSIRFFGGGVICSLVLRKQCVKFCGAN